MRMTTVGKRLALMTILDGRCGQGRKRCGARVRSPSDRLSHLVSIACPGTQRAANMVK